MLKALIVQGGWEGHEPRPVAEILAQALREHDFQVEIADSLDALVDAERLKSFNLVVPHWTMGAIEKHQFQGLEAAVASGVGFAGFHGGAGDAFRQHCGFQFLVGGQFVAHPDNIITYTVHNLAPTDPITRDLPDFDVTSEQYYMHVDPSNRVLAVTVFPAHRLPAGGDVVMPVVWTRSYRRARVFYSSLGHNAAAMQSPPVLTIAIRGMLWAARVL